MTQTTITQEGCFDLGAKNAINNNFSQLFSDKLDITSLTASATIDSSYAGKIISLDAAAGLTVTLPAASGTGYVYRFSVGTSVTSNNDIIKVANSSDVIQGVATIGASGGTSTSVGTASTDDTITMNGSTNGGLKGTWIEIRDVATNLFSCSMHGVGSGSATTPFSATV